MKPLTYQGRRERTEVPALWLPAQKVPYLFPLVTSPGKAKGAPRSLSAPLRPDTTSAVRGPGVHHRAASNVDHQRPRPAHGGRRFSAGSHFRTAALGSLTNRKITKQRGIT